jgi:hypothetical protein
MIAYINKSGAVIAVFKTASEEYKIYIRQKAGADFIAYGNLQGKFKHRADAEAAMTKYVQTACMDRSWKLCEDWRG